MESHIEAIRIAIQPEASDDTKQEGIRACRAVLAMLEAASPEPPAAADTTPKAAAPTPPPPPTAPPVPDVAAIVGALRGLPAEQLLDLAIARLRAALPAGAAVPASSPVRFQLIPLQHLRDTK